MHSSNSSSATEDILISGYNLNSGGGRLLLESLLKAAPETSKITLFGDHRLMNSGIDKTGKNVKVVFVKNNLFARILAELKMSSLSSKFSKHICLGNLPPLFGSKTSVYVFVHSRYLVDRSLDSKIPLRKLLITSLERLWFKIGIDHNEKIIVQTPTMKQMLLEQYGESLNVRVQAFTQLENSQAPTNLVNSFLYVASVDPHKNHKNLLEAWKILKQEQLSPQLTLVVAEPNKELADVVSKYKLNVEFKVNPEREELIKIYKSSKCLIHPSFFESLGLVLVEANHFGLDILAPEADYVRDIVSPKQTFDPASPLSIARAVKRYMGIQESFVKIETPLDFWQKL